MSTRDEAGIRRHLVLRIGDQRFAMPAEHIEDVIPESRPRPLGALPAHMPGVIRLHGRWIPAVNPLPLLGMVGAPGTAAAILHRGTQTYALLIDGAEGVLMVDEDEILTDHDAVGGTRSFIEDGTGPVTLLDADALFHAPAPRRVDANARRRTVDASARVVLVFTIGPYRLALPAECIREARGRSSLRAPAPGVPGLVGVVDVDGRAAPVFSIARSLGVSMERSARVLLVETPRGTVGIAADATHGVASVPVANADAHPLLGALLAPILRGVLPGKAGPLVELDITRLIDDDAWEMVRAALHGASPTGA